MGTGYSAKTISTGYLAKGNTHLQWRNIFLPFLITAISCQIFQSIVGFVFQQVVTNIAAKVAKHLHLKLSLRADAPETDTNCSSKILNYLVFTLYFQRGTDFLHPFQEKKKKKVVLSFTFTGRICMKPKQSLRMKRGSGSCLSKPGHWGKISVHEADVV